MSTNPPPQQPEEAAAPQEEEQPEQAPEYAPLTDPRLPTRKDISLKEFLNKMDDYAPIVRGSTSKLAMGMFANND